MKVKVSYTMNLNDVPDLVGEMYTNCIRQLKEHGRKQFNIHNIEKFVKEIKEIQEDLALISDQLEDCVSLAVGHKNAQNPAVSEPTEPVPEFVFPPSEDLLDESD